MADRFPEMLPHAWGAAAPGLVAAAPGSEPSTCKRLDTGLVHAGVSAAIRLPLRQSEERNAARVDA
jgi:hypothetical protein